MRFLPKANPLYENIPAHNVSVTDMLTKLGKGNFTGYVSHTCQNFEAYCIFSKGKLICAVATEAGRDKTGFEAMVQFFDKVFSSGGELNVYRMTTDLAMCAHALTLGTRLHNGEEVRQVDIKSMLAQIKSQELNGVVRFYTNERDALMFYRSGQPIGFYHDGARTIESSPEESRRVAALPGARIEVSATKSIEELMQYDLLQMVNLDKLWETTKLRHAQAQSVTRQQPQPAATIGCSDEKLAELVDDLKEVAMAYLSREGRLLIESCLQNIGGAAALPEPAKTVLLLDLIRKGALAIDQEAKIDEMVDLMQSEIAGRLAV